MKTISKVLAVFIVTMPFILITPSMADMGRGEHMCRQGGGTRHGGKHIFSRGWRETLTDKQKEEIDRLHLALTRQMSTIKAALMLKTAELNILVTQESPDTGALNRKIKEVAGLKEKMMRKKFSHILEMRKVLTPAQRTSFDLGLLSGGSHGGGKKMGH